MNRIAAESHASGLVLLAPRLAWAIAATVVVGFCAVTLILLISRDTRPWSIALAAVCLLSLCVLHMSFFTRRVPWTRAWVVAAIAAEACLVYAPLPLFGTPWIGVPSMLASTLLLILPPLAGWSALAVIILGIGFAQMSFTPSWLYFALVAATGLVATAAIYGLSRLAGLIAELHETRAELAKAAVASEQARFEQQSHDLLGNNLSSIIPKAELARRLIGRNAERFQQELAAILEITRSTLVDLRAVARDYRSRFRTPDAPSSAESTSNETRAQPSSRQPANAQKALAWLLSLVPSGAPADIAAGLAKALIAAVFCGLVGGYLLTWVYLKSPPSMLLTCAAYAGVQLAIELFYFCRPDVPLRSPRSYAMVLLVGALVYLPLLQFGGPLLGLPEFLAGNVLLVLRPRLAWPLFFAVLMSATLVAVGAGARWYETGQVIRDVIAGGLIVYGFIWLVRAIEELRAARVELAQQAVTAERLRFARDLHDSLGLRLSAIVLKTELARRLAPTEPEPARRELAEVLDVARLALADARQSSIGGRTLSLADEISSATSLLTAADFDVHVDALPVAMPVAVETVLAMVLREGATNVLRHSKGKRCEISIEIRDRKVCMDIVNDGVLPASGDPDTSGSGIRNLSHRVGSLDGELRAGVEPDGRFRLRACVPVSS
jgi:signal transduction histidine kinase